MGCIPDRRKYFVIDATNIGKNSLFEIVFQKYVYVLRADHEVIDKSKMSGHCVTFIARQQIY